MQSIHASIAYIAIAALALALFPMRRPPVRDDPSGPAPAVEHREDVGVSDNEETEA